MVAIATVTSRQNSASPHRTCSTVSNSASGNTVIVISLLLRMPNSQHLSPVPVYADMAARSSVCSMSLGYAEAETGKVCADLMAFWLFVHMLFHADTNSSVYIDWFKILTVRCP